MAVDKRISSHFGLKQESISILMVTIPLHTLIVEDNPDDAELMVFYLRKEGFQVNWKRVDNEPDFLAALEKPCDIIISDWSLPQFSGLRALQLYNERAKEIPFIIVSGGIGEEAAVDAMHRGASDYLLKDRLERLGQAVKNALEQKRLREEVRKTTQSLEKSEAELRGLFSALPDLVVLVDQDEKIIKVAPTKFPFLHSPEDLMGRRLADLFSPQLTAQFRHTIQDVLASGETRMMEFQYTVNGKPGWFETSISPISDKETIWVIRNVSERKVMLSQLADLLKRQTAIADLGWNLTKARSEEEIYRLAFRTFKALTPTIYFSFSNLNEETSHLKPCFAIFDEVEFNYSMLYLLEQGYNHPEALFYQVIQSGKAAFFSDPEQIYQGRISIEGISTRTMHSVCCLPVFAEEQLIGLIELQSQQENAYREDDLEWLTLIANQVGLSIQKTRLFNETQRRNAELATLAVIDAAVLTHFEKEEIYTIILEQVLMRMGVDAAALSINNEQTQTLNYVKQIGFSQSFLIGKEVKIGERLVGKAALTQQVYSCDLSIPENQCLLLEGLQEEGFQTYYAVSLISDSRLIGVLELFKRISFTADNHWRNFLEMLANQIAIAIHTLQLYQNLQTAHQKLIEAYDLTITGWSHALDLRDKETEDHTQRVTDLTVQMAKMMGLDEETIIHIRRGALLHDIGKIGIPDKILLKPGSLTAEEWSVMRTHPILAYDLMAPIEYLQPALDIPYCHHEKWDGTGYPRGLKGEEIPLAARIFAVVDVYDALISDRPYRKAWQKEQALDYIRSQAGTHFDPQVVELFMKVMAQSQQ